MVAPNTCSCHIGNATNIGRYLTGNHSDYVAIIKDVYFEGPHKVKCRLHTELEHWWKLQCNTEEIAIASGGANTTILLICAVAILIFIAFALSYKLNKANKKNKRLEDNAAGSTS